MARDRRKKRARRTETRRRQFLCFRARDIWPEPVTYGEHTFTEVHVVAYSHQYTLTLKGPGKSMGVGSMWDRRSFYATSISEDEVKRRVEALLESAREGRLTNLRDHTWIGCLY